MLWRGRRGSTNIEDRRGQGGGRPFGGGGLGGFGGGLGGGLGRGGGFRLGGGGGLVGLIIVIAVAIFFGGGLDSFLGNDREGAYSSRTGVGTEQGEDLKQFVSVVLADTEDVWRQVFRAEGLTYHEPTLVLYTGGTQSGCGYAQSAVGPFYCPGDQKVYLDLDFFQELASRFGAAGDFAQAYVIAHEIGHHVQDELGILGKVDDLRARSSQSDANALSVRLELQADCLAGVFAHYAEETKGILEPGDIQEALDAAAAIGDDRLQRQATGRVVPDSFTHGTSAQRQRWFQTGYQNGQITGCDTFGARQL